MIGGICEEEYWIGLVVSGWYVGDIIWMISVWISYTYHLDLIHISSRNHTHISSKFHPRIIEISPSNHPYIAHISSRNNPNITHIIQILPMHVSKMLPTCHPNITHSIFFTTPQLDEKSSFNPDMARLLQKKLHFLSSRYYPNIIQISSGNHPEIIQISSRNHHPDIILVKSQVLILVWHDYSRLKLHF